MSAGKVVAALLLLGCGSSHDGKPAATGAPVLFHCQKAAGGAGVRACVASDVAPPGDVFDTAEAWCITERVSIADPRTRMTCVPTQDECARKLMLHQYVRSGCVRTTPDHWTAAEAAFSKPDMFACEPDVLSTEAELSTQRCIPFPADDFDQMPDKDFRLAAEAWCFDAPIRGTLLCFASNEECTRRARIDPFAEGACAQHSAQTALAAMFGRDRDR